MKSRVSAFCLVSMSAIAFNGCSLLVASGVPVGLEDLVQDPKQYLDQNVTVKGILTLGREGDALCTKNLEDHDAKCIGLQRPEPFMSESPFYPGQVDLHEVRFVAKVVANPPPPPPPPCVREGRCVLFNFERPYELQVLTPIEAVK